MLDVAGFRFPSCLQFAQFFHFALATADEAVLLQLEVAELLFEVKTDLNFQGGCRIAGELWFNLQNVSTPEIEQSRFEAGETV